MTSRTARWISGVVVAACAIAYLIVEALILSTTHQWENYFLLLGFPVTGAVIVSHQPRNTIGWLLVVSGASTALGLLGAESVKATLDADPAQWQRNIAWMANFAFIGGFEGLVLALAFLFPTGRTLSVRWRFAGIGVALIVGTTYLIEALSPGPLWGYFADTPQLINPFGVSGFDSLADRIRAFGLPIGVLVVTTALLAVITRVRRARGIERLQLQWFALAVGLVGGGLLISVLVRISVSDRWTWVSSLAESIFFMAAALGIPAAIGVAILRYRLYDIGQIINKTLVYGALTAVLIALYLGLVLVSQFLLRSVTPQSDLAIAVSTLTVAALFQPMRRRIQAGVDRRFYRRRYDAAQTVEAFSIRARNVVDLATLTGELVAVVNQTLNPAHVSLWLRPTEERSIHE